MLGLKRGAFGSAPIFKVDAEEESKVGEKENQKKSSDQQKGKSRIGDLNGRLRPSQGKSILPTGEDASLLP